MAPPRRFAPGPGFPLQVLGFANANPVGFPLQSLARAPAAAQEIAPGNFLRITRRKLVARNGFPAHPEIRGGIPPLSQIPKNPYTLTVILYKE
jgi:hypothetical protein